METAIAIVGVVALVATVAITLGLAFFKAHNEKLEARMPQTASSPKPKVEEEGEREEEVEAERTAEPKTLRNWIKTHKFWTLFIVLCISVIIFSVLYELRWIH